MTSYEADFSKNTKCNVGRIICVVYTFDLCRACRQRKVRKTHSVIYMGFIVREPKPKSDKVVYEWLQKVRSSFPITLM